MKTDKLLSALCYFSVLFAPFLLPLIVYFVTDDAVTKSHAKKSFLSHVIPAITIIAYMFIFLGAAFAGQNELIGIVFLSGFPVVLLVNFIVFVWNIVKGIKILKTV
ncbi:MULTISPECIES: DUF4870 domain-containing protein [Bacillaceae]|uniref:DUF4870 domain-containing protein n=1 Tax=Metabacillus sediminis TaxID=3117746 RepID=A0ABZ2NFW4_9BACI|nr:DUF4870 domain-containing protein [Bacillus sp. SJS]KZZ84900.1 hypothetical protein AS29_007550 [Bacillus sp. SJS]